ncbi:MAG: TetR/AcrR family transcriptional regulator [Pseudomonadota bacterium]
MGDTQNTKPNSRSARTREQFLLAGERLFAERGIDSVSLNEITVAANQKNRNALQYHFGGRQQLLQAIIDQHGDRVHELRQQFLSELSSEALPDARAAAQTLVMPIARYLQETPRAIHYIKILSQLAALNNDVLNPDTRSGLNFQREERLAAIMSGAAAHLQPTEAQRRYFLIVSMTFHCLADACRAAETEGVSPTLRQREAVFEQLMLAIESLLAAPPVPER